VHIVSNTFYLGFRMKITVFGSGYVGLVAAACLAEVGNDVVCMDIDKNKIDMLNRGLSPIYEPGLEELLAWNLNNKRLHFTTDKKSAVQHGECQFIAVGTPPQANGKANLQFVFDVATTIALYMNKYTIIIDKSTVPIGTADQVRDIIHHGLKSRDASIGFDVVSNPEFLKEGAALEDFRKPDRIVLGVESQCAENVLRELYAPFNRNNDRLMVMDTRSAELTKYASNAMLATKVSFMNEISNLAEAVGADVEKVRNAMGADHRIGHQFTYPGCGYGGSCFGKDVQALAHTAEQYGADSDIIRSVELVNTKQKQKLFSKIHNFYKSDLTNKKFAIWGLSFKPETDDMRDAPSINLINSLLEAGAFVRAYDPEAIQEAKKTFPESSQIYYAASPEDALKNVDALVILTQWRVFRSPDFATIQHSLKDNVIFDGRNIYDPEMMQEMGIQYFGMGRGLSIKTPCSTVIIEQGIDKVESEMV